MTPNCPGCTASQGSPLSTPHRTPESCVNKSRGLEQNFQESPLFLPTNSADDPHFDNCPVGQRTRQPPCLQCLTAESVRGGLRCELATFAAISLASQLPSKVGRRLAYDAFEGARKMLQAAESRAISNLPDLQIRLAQQSLRLLDPLARFPGQCRVRSVFGRLARALDATFSYALRRL